MACPLIKLAEPARCVKKVRFPRALRRQPFGIAGRRTRDSLVHQNQNQRSPPHPQMNSIGVSIAGSRLLFTGQVMAARSSFSLFSALKSCGIRILEVRR